MKRYINIAIAGLLAIATFTSCEDFLERQYEGGTLDDDQIKETVEALPQRINSSISGMYSLLGKPDGYFSRGSSSYRADDFGYPCVALSQDLNSGNMVNIESGYDWFSTALEFSDRSPTYANPTLRYGLFYKIIYAANEVLIAIPDDTESEDLIHAKGQAQAVRAFCYLSLAPYFQYKYVGNEDQPSVPIVEDGTDYRNNPRIPLSELYTYITDELSDAILNLDGYARSNKGAIDKDVAYGLRARAYLNMEMWNEAAADADKALTSYAPYAMTDLTAPGFYNADDANWIWALLLPSDVISDANYATWPSQLGSFSGDAYVPFAGIYRSINNLLYDKLPTTDVRRAWWLDANLESPYLDGLTWSTADTSYVGQAIAPAKIPNVKEPMPQYANVKFGQRSGIGSAYNDGDWCMMRAEEMILIKAEATAMGGDLASGKTILENFVKNFRDPSYTASATDATSFQDEVWYQRRIELWGEGFGISDAMRLGKNVVRYKKDETTNVPEIYRFNIAKDDPWLLMRFAQGETTNNSEVEQNEGGTQPAQGDGETLVDGVL